MGVPRDRLPSWDDIQFVTAQLANLPQLDGVNVEAGVTIGPRARKPLHLELPLFVSDMSFGALSKEAKIALAEGVTRYQIKSADKNYAWVDGGGMHLNWTWPNLKTYLV